MASRPKAGETPAATKNSQSLPAARAIAAAVPAKPAIDAMAETPVVSAAEIPPPAVMDAAPEVIETAAPPPAFTETTPSVPAVMDAALPAPEIVETAAPAPEVLDMAPPVSEIIETAQPAPAVIDAVAPPAAEPVKTTPIAAVRFGSDIAETTAKFKQGMEKTMKTAEEFAAFGQANIEAFVKSGQIWAAGIQDLTKQAAAAAQASFDETVSTFKAMSTVKTVKDAIDLQTSLARQSLEKTVAETTRMTDASLKLTEQAMAPIAARMNTAMETFSKTV